MSIAQETTAVPLTYEAYMAEGRVEGSYDIIDGERVFTSEATVWKHQRIVGNVFALLRDFERASQQGHVLTAPFDVTIRRFPLRTRQPDVLFITNERLESVGGVPAEGPLEIGPELVIEVLSPGETPRSVRGKLEDFRSVGVREAWLISPEAETVQVLRLDGEGTETVAVYIYGQTVESFAVPGLTVALADIFAE